MILKAITLILWILSAWVAWGKFGWSDHYYFSQSLLDLILPWVSYIWLVILVSVFIYPKVKQWIQDYPKQTSNYSSRFLIIIFVQIIMMIVLWPPQIISNLWCKDLNSHQVMRSTTDLKVMTWNTQRLGDLALRNKKQVIKERTQCVIQGIKTLDQVGQVATDIFAFQEVNNQGLQVLEEALSLHCQFISYHPTQRKKTAGLGLCVRKESKWKINYVRKINLEGGGRWRALFAELSTRTQPQVNLNLINLHFLPHRIAPKTVRTSLISPQTAWRLFKNIQETSSTQQIQANGLLQVIQDYRDPTIILGDFNAPPRVGAHPLLVTDWFDVWEQVGTGSGSTRIFGGIIPLRVDYIYARRGGMKAHMAKVGERELTDCSDHLPIVASLSVSS